MYMKKYFFKLEADLSDKSLRPPNLTRLKLFKYTEENMMKDTRELTDEERKIILTEDTVYENLLNDSIKSAFQDFEICLRTKRVSGEKFNFF